MIHNPIRSFFVLITLAILNLSCLADTTSAVNSTPPDAPSSRLVVVGDVHGDYARFFDLLRRAELINKRGRWSGDNAVLVQLGDVLDRGAESRKANDLLMRLQKEAKKSNGAVHVLIGNHEAMIAQGDMRYVHPGEYDAFKDRQSRKRQQKYYERTVEYLNTLPENERPLIDEDFKNKWFDAHPPGSVEMRQAWAPTGEYGRWLLSRPVVLKRANTLFLHGGISATFESMSIEEINMRARTELSTGVDAGDDAVVNTPDGPLWYRGLAVMPESEENHALVDRILNRYGVERIVVGHTPLMRGVMPRFDGKVIVNDVGLSKHYGGGFAYLEIADDVVAIHHRGRTFALPTDDDARLDYLAQIMALEEDSDNRASIQKQIDSLTAAPPAVEESATGSD